MVSPLGRATLAVTERGPVRKLFTDTRPGRAVSTRFVAGETLDEAVAVAHELNAAGATVSLDHLGEHVFPELLVPECDVRGYPNPPTVTHQTGPCRARPDFAQILLEDVLTGAQISARRWAGLHEA